MSTVLAFKSHKFFSKNRDVISKTKLFLITSTRPLGVSALNLTLGNITSTLYIS